MKAGNVRVHNVSLPLFNDMWAYRPEWANRITPIAETRRGAPSTVYRLDLCSHTGTYIETSQHKLNTDVPLDSFSEGDFFREAAVVVLKNKQPAEPITLEEFRRALLGNDTIVKRNGALVIASGWGRHHREPSYLGSSPFFEPRLTDHINSIGLGLLAVDVPVIDNQRRPYNPVKRLFEANPRLLLLAPLFLDPKVLKTGLYTLCAFPLNIPGVCATPCTPVLIETV